jgi:hypothetical protein
MTTGAGAGAWSDMGVCVGVGVGVGVTAAPTLNFITVPQSLRFSSVQPIFSSSSAVSLCPKAVISQ